MPSITTANPNMILLFLYNYLMENVKYVYNFKLTVMQSHFMANKSDKIFSGKQPCQFNSTCYHFKDQCGPWRRVLNRYLMCINQPTAITYHIIPWCRRHRQSIKCWTFAHNWRDWLSVTILSRNLTSTINLKKQELNMVSLTWQYSINSDYDEQKAAVQHGHSNKNVTIKQTEMRGDES
jgi:hypothetical protein